MNDQIFWCFNQSWRMDIYILVYKFKKYFSKSIIQCNRLYCVQYTMFTSWWREMKSTQIKQYLIYRFNARVSMVTCNLCQMLLNILQTAQLGWKHLYGVVQSCTHFFDTVLRSWTQLWGRNVRDAIVLNILLKLNYKGSVDLKMYRLASHGLYHYKYTF